MPYIKQEDRERLTANGRWNGTQIRTAGELNYLLTIMFLSDYWEDMSTLEHAVLIRIESFFNSSDRKYQDHNNIIGALECCKKEFKRRFVFHPRIVDVVKVLETSSELFYDYQTAPYEDLKIKENGDVQ